MRNTLFGSINNRFSPFYITAVFLLFACLYPSKAYAAKFNIGDTVEVYDTGVTGLNLRSCPALSCTVRTIMTDGTQMTVNGGPYYGDGYTWWYLYGYVNAITSSNGTYYQAGYYYGYAVEDYLRLVSNPCIYSISPTSKSFTSNGGSDTVSVTASLGSCSWTATSNANWITITSGSSGTGNGTVNYSVSSNSSISPRTGTMTIAGQTFTVSQSGVPTPPTVTTGTYQIISSSSAQLFGTVNPNGLPTTGWFQWGTTNSYGNNTSAESLGSGTSVVQMLQTISGLSPNTTYHFMAVAQNSAGTSYGDDMAFTTPPPPLVPPTVTTEAATSVSSSSATLNGTVNPNGSPTTGWFEWGTTASYGNMTPTFSGGSGTSPVPMSWPISGLASNTTYHFRAVGQNGAGTDYGSDMSFTTATTTGITVTSPNGGESWQVGTTQTILWTYTGNPGSYVKIELLKGTSVNSTITSSTSIGSNGSGSYSWTIPTTQTTGSDYKVRVTSTSNSAYTDTSDGNFTISSTEISVTYFKINNDASSATSRKVTLNNTATGSPTHYMASESSTLSGASWQTYSTAPSFTLSSGNGNKTVYFKVKNSNSDESSVVSDSIVLSEPVTVTVTSPNGGESWQSGTTQTILWTYTGNLGSYVKIELLKGTSVNSTITSSASIGSNGSGSYNWTIPTTQTTGSDYKVRVTSTSNSSYTDTSDGNFTITSKPLPPTVTTGSATNVTTNSATLNGTVNANGLSTTAWFEYGTTSGLYSYKTSTQGVTGTTDITVSSNISGLSAGKTYYYRLVAKNSDGATYGNEKSFITLDEENLLEKYAPILYMYHDEYQDEHYYPQKVEVMVENSDLCRKVLGVEVVVKENGTFDLNDLMTYNDEAYYLRLTKEAKKTLYDETKWKQGPTIYGRQFNDDNETTVLQYWFFYIYNDWDDIHEGDWEMIQIVLSDNNQPIQITYSIHHGGETFHWDDERIDKINNEHPAIYITLGGHGSWHKTGDNTWYQWKTLCVLSAQIKHQMRVMYYIRVQ
jgi:molybdopterin-binding protein